MCTRNVTTHTETHNPLATARRHLAAALADLHSALDAATDEHVRAGLAFALADVQAAGRRLDNLRHWCRRGA